MAKQTGKNSIRMKEIQIISDYVSIQHFRGFNKLHRALKQSETLPNTDAIANILIKMQLIRNELKEAMLLLAPLQSSDAWENDYVVEYIMSQIDLNIKCWAQIRGNEHDLKPKMNEKLHSDTQTKSSEKCDENQSASRNQPIPENCPLDDGSDDKNRTTEEAPGKKSKSRSPIKRLMDKFGSKSPSKASSMFYVELDKKAESKTM